MLDEMLTGEPGNEFSVFAFTEDGMSYRLVQLVNAARATDVAHRLIRSIAAQAGEVRRIIITDGGDAICFEWLFGKGITIRPPVT
jgi:hypothetical protein